jgi:hypothetical protein
MSVILLILGIVMTGAGLAALGFGIPINEFTLATPLIVAGTVALCGGLILIGLSATVAELRRIAALLKARPLVQPARRGDLPSVVTGPAHAAAPPPMPASAGPAYAPAPMAPPQSPPPLVHPPLDVRAAPPPLDVRAAPPPPPRPRPPEMPSRDMPSRDMRHMEMPPAPSSSVDVSAAAIERLRTSISRPERPRSEPSLMSESDDVPLSPNGNHQPVQARRVSPEMPDPRLMPDDRLAGGPVETPKSSRLDFLFRSRQAAPSRPENLEPNWPPESRPARSAPPDVALQPRYAEPARTAAPAAASPPSPPPQQAAPAPPPSVSLPAEPPQPSEPEVVAVTESQPGAILKSGVVDGLAYTLFADGAIEAKLPDGTVRFGSIAELRAHIEKLP